MSVSNYKKPNIKTNFSSTPTWLYLIVVVALYVFGAYAFYDFIVKPENASILAEMSEALKVLVPISLDFLPLLIAFILTFLVVTVILAFVILWIMSKVAKQVTIFVSVLFPVLMMVVGVLMIGGGIIMPGDEQLDASMMGMFIAGFGFLLLAFVIWKFRVIERSGKFVEFSAQLVLDEKAVLAMPLLLGIYSIITGFFMLFGFLKIYSLFEVTNALGETELSYPGLIMAIIFEYFYLIVYLGVYYSLSAGVISYASDWYRGLDPDLGSAMKDVRQVFPIILKFAFAMATVKIIMQIFTGAARGQTTRTGGRNAGAAIGGLIFAAIASLLISIIGAIWMFLNYFTLVSIVQNKKGLGDSIKDSAKTTWGALVDVLVGETGFGLTTFIFAVVNSLLWIGIGFSLGFAVTQELTYGIVFAVIFVFLGTLPYNVVTMPMKVAFRTFIYSYAKDSVEGFKKPSRLPAELRNEFKTLSRKDVKKRGMRDPSEYF
ncbi:hypothetical protein CEE45_01815 [Candidatus Heimdallarchaeota archaeon B3_Heim]|nr:MAG: hypothetical protein CEE45_01815 [Candidatus Heimdallarchaeota archaeon B3_Heim]